METQTDFEYADDNVQSNTKSFWSPYILLIKGFKRKLEDIFIVYRVIFTITGILALLLYFVENNAQPDVYDSFWTSFTWAISKYIQGANIYGDFIPITPVGMVLSTMLGILGLAILTIPVGLIGAGFTEVIQEESKARQNRQKAKAIEEAFESYRPTLPYYRLKKGAPRFIDVKMLQTRLSFGETDIFDAIKHSEKLRLREKKSNLTKNIYYAFVVEHYDRNCRYGVKKFIQNSNLTIINPIGYTEQGISHFTHALSLELLEGICSYISNEEYSATAFEKHRMHGFRRYKKVSEPRAYNDYLDDLRQCVKKDSWVIVFDSSKADRAHAIHINFGAISTPCGSGLEHPTVKDIRKLKSFYDYVSRRIFETSGHKVAMHEEIASMPSNDICRFIHNKLGANVIRIYLSVEILDGTDKLYYQSMEVIADAIKECLI